MTTLVTVTICCGVVLSVPTFWALARMDWIASITPLSCARNASPSSIVQGRSSFIFLITSGNRATAFTFVVPRLLVQLGEVVRVGHKPRRLDNLQRID